MPHPSPPLSCHCHCHLCCPTPPLPAVTAAKKTVPPTSAFVPSCRCHALPLPPPLEAIGHHGCDLLLLLFATAPSGRNDETLPLSESSALVHCHPRPSIVVVLDNSPLKSWHQRTSHFPSSILFNVSPQPQSNTG